MEQVAAQVDMIEESRQRENISACVQVLAGLRFNQSLIRRLFREEIMRESVIYQEILQEGLRQGLQQGLQQAQQQEASLILRLLARRLGAVEPQFQERIRELPIPQLEELGEALLDFSTTTDLAVWLDEHQP